MRLKVVLGPDPLGRRALVRRKADLVLDWPFQKAPPKPFRKVGIINFLPDGKAEEILILDGLAEEIWVEGEIFDGVKFYPEFLALCLLADEIVKVTKTCQLCGESGIIKLDKGVVLCRRCLVRKGWLYRFLAFWTGKHAEGNGN